MPSSIVSSDPVTSSWNKRISMANQEFEKWENRFECKILERYYEGRQGNARLGNDDIYILNLIYSTWKTKSPGLLFKRPKFSFEPRPKEQRWDSEEAWQKANLASDLVNTIVGKSLIKFDQNCAMALLDTGPYYGLIEVGYAADWKENPNATKPVVNKDYNQEVEKVKAKEQPELPEEEQIFIRHIPAHRFRIFGNDSWDLSQANACGYYMFVRRIDLAAFGEKYATGAAIDEYVDEDDKADSLVKVWKIWDHRKKEVFLFNGTDGEFLGKSIKWKRLPVFPLIFDPRRRGFYPMPLFYNWRPSQDDYNEAREQLRAHRRRSKRAFQCSEEFDEEELQKLVNGPDGVVVKTVGQAKIEPIVSSAVDNSIIQTMVIAKDDFNIVSQTSSEARGEGDRVTATQASITNKYSEIRNKYDAEVVANWLTQIGLEILLQAIDKLTLPTWIRIGVGQQPQGKSVEMVSKTFQLITMEQLDGYDFECAVTVESLSPITNQEEKNKLMEFLATIQQYPILSMSPNLIRALAERFGFKDENVIREMQQMALLAMQAKVVQESQGAGGSAGGSQGGNPAQKTVEQMTPPDQAEIENQLAGQGVPT